MSLFDDIGGEPALRSIIDEFVDRCFADIMIGFQFQRVSRANLKRFEYQHAAAFLGADVNYEGRELADAHERHRVLIGQFNRRRQLLIETLADHRAPSHVVDAWIAHQDSLRDQILARSASTPKSPHHD